MFDKQHLSEVMALARPQDRCAAVEREPFHYGQGALSVHRGNVNGLVR